MAARIFLSIFFLAIALGASAEKNRLRSERVAMSAEHLEGCLWDASILSEIDSRARASVSIGESGLIFESVRPGFTDLYLLRGDSVYFRGYTAGRDMGVLVCDTLVVAGIPLGDDAHNSSFSGSAQFINGRHGSIYGELNVAATRRGRFIFAPGDTISAIEVHEHRATISDMPDPGLTCELDFWRWYVPGSKLPFAVQYCENGKDARFFITAGLPETGGTTDDADEEALLRAVLKATKVEISEDGVTVSFGAVGVVHAEVSVFDAMGHLYAFSECITGSGETVFLDTSGLAPGSYLAVVMLDGKPEFSIKKGFRR